MSDFRCYAPDLDQAKETIELSQFESHHLISTNRARKGDSVIVFNGLGLEWEAMVVDADRRKCLLHRNRVIVRKAPSLEITLAVAIIKGKTFDIILRQATELGTSCIQPLVTERTQVRLDENRSKSDKWSQQLIEACKQSGNPWLPRLKQAVKLEDYLETTDQTCSCVASLEAGTQPWNTLKSSDGKATLFVGPEGDFSPGEYRLLEDHKILPVSLGAYVLRSETAVTAGLTRLRAVLERN
ncbi:MAG: 16S rRNA (uracil(1498)-N(3))-methyltransferase [Verrucomicrobiae bacterium]|nr:16S rRNA (uracil(1498)-N(3))-methyltransferase [Verrucomicrobiae bacterium]